MPPDGTTTQPSKSRRTYGALNGTVVSPAATAKTPQVSASFPSRVSQSS